MQQSSRDRRTIPALLDRAAERFGDQPYIVTPEQELTFGAAEERSRRLAGQLLGSGIGKGTRVGLLFPQGPDFVVTLLAITRIGAVAVPLSTFLRPPELRRAIRHVDLHLLLVPPVLFDESVGSLLEASLPGLGDVPVPDLRLSGAPFLRGIWMLGGATATWARTVSTSAEAEGGRAGRDLILEIESEVAPSDLMAIISTSGTTSEPKAVVHTHQALIGLAERMAGLHELPVGVRTFTSMPFFWVGGLTVVLLTHLWVGGTVITVERLDGPRTLDLIERTRPDRLVGWSLVDRFEADPSLAGRDLHRLREIEVPPRSGPLRHGSLGMSETGGPHSGAPASVNDAGIAAELRGSFGPPVDGMEHRIIDPETGAPVPDGVEGELCVRGEFLMDGLYKRSRLDTFDADGWYRTGDRGRNVDGLLYFTGRLTDVIKTSGANVAPAEVQGAVESLPGVRAAFVVGVPDEERGELVGCVVCPEDGLQLDGESLRNQLGEHLSTFKIPRRIVIIPYDEAPLLPSGKVDRRGVIALLASGD